MSKKLEQESRATRAKNITDAKAEWLESKGLWRRAARRWLEVMDESGSDKIRSAAADRRNYCDRMASTPGQTEKTWWV